ncbi:myosin heavy chain, clone 203-like [Clytia hemisphaerica]|uniref:myosin heavy chain, clone 203-like n=1 Tax=Clytia hemisphaerica TaxID=252671 RepID=UPI0034D5ED65
MGAQEVEGQGQSYGGNPLSYENQQLLQEIEKLRSILDSKDEVINLQQQELNHLRDEKPGDEQTSLFENVISLQQEVGKHRNDAEFYKTAHRKSSVELEKSKQNVEDLLLTIEDQKNAIKKSAELIDSYETQEKCFKLIIEEHEKNLSDAHTNIETLQRGLGASRRVNEEMQTTITQKNRRIADLQVDSEAMVYTVNQMQRRINLRDHRIAELEHFLQSAESEALRTKQMSRLMDKNYERKIEDLNASICRMATKHRALAKRLADALEIRERQRSAFSCLVEQMMNNRKRLEDEEERRKRKLFSCFRSKKKSALAHEMEMLDELLFCIRRPFEENTDGDFD